MLREKMRAYRRDEDVDRIGFAVFVRHAMNERTAVPVRLKVFVRKGLDEAREAVLRLQGTRAGEKARRCAKVVFIGGRDACLQRIANLVVFRDRNRSSLRLRSRADCPRSSLKR
jgi:hypothetical protein